MDVRQGADMVDHGQPDSDLLLDVVRGVLGRSGRQRWALTPSDAWSSVSPPQWVPRPHGWKLHVSATPLSAPIVLARCAQVLLEHECVFKFATDLQRVMQLVDSWYDRGSGGKFITVYPRDDAHFQVVANSLHYVTQGLMGPQILSDRQLRPGSLVYYRYGEFAGERVFTDSGMFVSRLVGPDGATFSDARNAWFSPPAWAGSPFGAEPITPDVAESVLLAGRYRVTGAIRHANKGGVFRAVDEQEGTEVVIKQARAHVGASLDGTDVRDRLRAEARMLELLAPLKAGAANLGLFEEQGDLFLVQEQISGQSLQLWAAEHAAVSERGLDTADALAMARHLVAMLRSVHEAGFVLCDLKPHNVIVTPFEQLRLIDVEYVTRSGQRCFVGHTRGFAAPEMTAEGDGQQVPQAAWDFFSLGVTLFCVLTALSPQWVSGRAGVRPSRMDRTLLLTHIAKSHPVLTGFVEPIIGLTEPDPGRRWSLAQAEEFLYAPARTANPAPVQLAARLASDESLDRLVTDGILHLRRTITPQATMLWPRNRSHAEMDPCNAWSGAAGVLATLTRAARAFTDDDELRSMVAQTAAWTAERLPTVPRLLPGLGLGRSGTAWALYDAAQFLGAERLAAQALDLARALPTQWPRADFYCGLSGAGMAHLHLWQATKDTTLFERAVACADAVLAMAQRTGEDWTWPIPDDTEFNRAEQSAYGFTSGVAGVGTFLLAAAHATRGHDPIMADTYLEAALGAGDTLARVATVSNQQVQWPRSVTTRNSVDELHLWHKGPAGIGLFLIRLWAASGEQRFADLAEQAAATVAHNPWRIPTAAFSGLAGGGQFLLDMADTTGQQAYRDQAHELATVIHAQHTEHDNLHLVSEPVNGASYMDGTAGILDFLLRLRHGGPHPWIPQTHA
jgi:serine/threonine protein kinase